ncbi:MAG: hypothetical protein GY869_17685 [Planctomycetes bacterium]|nr:hypothetical protein [Planctomycetota bacterium]
MTDQTPNFVAMGVYIKGDEPGTLHTEWVRSDWVSSDPQKGIICLGTATGGPKDGFAGSYTVVYTDEQGKPIDPFIVTITSAGDAYQLTWERGGQQPYIGVGIELDGKLVFGWMPNK